MERSKGSVLLLQLVLIFMVTHQGAWARFQIGLRSTNPPTEGKPNTFIATSDQIASSLLGSGVPALMWGVVNSGDVTAVCQNIVSTGSLSFDATLIDQATGNTEDVTFQILSTGGCEAAPDESGTEAVLIDNNGRKSALVCPNNAGSTGCGVYLTGDDVTALYYQGLNGGSRRRLMGSSSRSLLDCETGSQKGAVGGIIGGVLDSTLGCLETGPFLFIFCMIGAVGAQAGLGALGGCAVGAMCFPEDATVETASGESKKMSDLQVGEKVAVRTARGNIAFEDVYAFGHTDAHTASKFIRLSITPLRSNSSRGAFLDLSASHFVPVTSGTGGGALLYKRAQDIPVGEVLWASAEISEKSDDSDHQALSLFVVTDISTVLKKGLYNPFTMSGTILVNGVVASVHSDWFLDGLFDALSWTQFLPSAYQVVLSPARLFYRMVGKNVYVALYTWLDSHLSLVQVLSGYSGPATSAALVLLVSFLLRTRFTKKHV